MTGGIHDGEPSEEDEDDGEHVVDALEERPKVGGRLHTPTSLRHLLKHE